MRSSRELINRFSPKQPKRRMQLRNHAGQIANLVEEHAILCKFVQDTWHGNQLSPVYSDVAPGTPFCEADVLRALSTIPLSKAVARTCAPGFLWNALASWLAPWIFRQLQQWWTSVHPIVPQQWKTGWLNLIPKPGKPPTSPTALRPICLQDPIGKAIIGMLSRIGMESSLSCLVDWPLWAYIPWRSTHDALLRLMLHCQDAQRVLTCTRSNPINRAQFPSRPKCGGAISLFLDLSRAFDSLDRNRLFGKLHQYGVDSRIAKLLAEWHDATQYVVTTGDESSAIPVFLGVRQGCKAAPWLWNMFVRILVDDITTMVSEDWLRSNSNMFADDFQAGDTFTNAAQLTTILAHFGHILDFLTDYGLLINLTKSMVLFEVTGTAGKRQRHLLTEWRDGQEWLRIPGHSRTFSIPIVKSVKYLGAVLSYRDSADLTMRHRMKLATIAFGRLARWLQCKRGLTVYERFRIWQTCVFPVATYGIFTVGLQSRHISFLQQQFHKMIRKLIGDHAYVTGHSNLHALQQYGIPEPLTLLWQSAHNLLRSVTERCHHAASHDIILQQDWTHLTDLCNMIWTMHTGSDFAPQTSLQQALQCHWCSFQTSNLATLRRHYTTVHGHRVFRTSMSHHFSHMLHGLPQCRYCLQSFTSWRSFQIHIQRGCQAFHQHHRIPLLIDGMPRVPAVSRSDEAVRGSCLLSVNDLHYLRQQEWGDRLLLIVQQRNWQQLKREPAILEVLAKRCCLCGQWVGRPQEMHKHLKLHHSQFWPNVLTKSTLLTQTMVDDSPCAYCQCVFLKTHSCNTWTQVCMLWLYGAGIIEEPLTSRPSKLTCEICDVEMDSMAAMYHHLLQEHQLHSAGWNPSRDTVEGMPACAHCGQAFGTLSSVRSHIIQGRCPLFDPFLPSETKPILEQWRQAMCEGAFHDVMRDSALRQQLTLSCQCCFATYSRASDLMLHLMSSHSVLWKDAESLTAVLVQFFYGSLGCCCNPGTAVRRLNHVCVPFKQLAMQFCRLPSPAIFYPVRLTDAMLLQVTSPALPREFRFAFDRFFIQRDFAGIMQCSDLLSKLSTICLRCGEVHPAADLCQHLREVHACCSGMVHLFAQQLLPLMMQHNVYDHTCFGCGLIYNIPKHLQIQDVDSDSAAVDRQALTKSHFLGQCPCLLQLAGSLTLAFNDGRYQHDGWVRCLQTDLGGVPLIGASPDHGSGPDAGTQSKCIETSSKRRRLQGKREGQEGQIRRRPSTGHDRHSQPDDQASSTTRSRTPVPAQRGHLPLLFQQQNARRRSSDPPEGDQGLASLGSTGTQTITLDPIETEADPDLVPGAAHQAESADRGRHSISVGTGSPEEQCSLARPVMPIPGMEPNPEMSQSWHQTSNQPEENDREHPRDVRDVHGGQPGQVFPRSPTLCEWGEHSVETSIEHACRPSVSPDALALRQQHLAAPGGQSEGTQPVAKWTCPSTCEVDGNSTSSQGQGQRSDWSGLTNERPWLLSLLAAARLDNPSNWCFANSTVIALLWCTLSSDAFDHLFWGQHCNALHAFVLSLDKQMGNLANEHWFQAALQCWGRCELNQSSDSISQHDAAEFIDKWIAQMQSTAFQMSWERRVDENGTVHRVDSSADSLPLFFQFDAVLTCLPRTSLSSLARVWHQVDGMVAALLHPSQCLCVHVDRCFQSSHTSSVCKCNTAIDPEEECLIPIFMDDTLKFEYMEYTPVVYQAHLGQDAAGHYRTAIRIRPGVSSEVRAVRWLLCDDCCSPQAVWELPQWFQTNTTLAWLIRTDMLALFEYGDRTPPDVQDSVSEMLEMFALAASQSALHHGTSAD